ncbi:MAG: hypothetical protein J1F60_09160 [Oscillospiraceae bacterium]|nr:hypothetical protein [Oscillospiraceae bacterium]
MKNKKIYDDDDGRTIADMSGVGVPSPVFGGFGKRNVTQEEGEQPRKPEMQPFEMTRKERKMYIWGALGAALLIAGVFIVGLGLAILLMVLAWSR